MNISPRYRKASRLRYVALLSVACHVPDAFSADAIAKTTTPTPFIAQYKATYNGSEFEDIVSRKLERLPDGTYRHSYSADHLLYFLHEESQLELKGCNVQPLHYISRRGNVFRKREKSIDFDWNQRTASYNDEGKKGEFKLVADTVDPMSVYLRIACQITSDLQVLTFPETDDDNVEMREYRTLGAETIETPDGKLDTIRIERVHKNKKRQTYLWLMTSNPVVVVRVRQKDTDGSVYSLDLTSWKPLSAK
jgi:uncharacterized protein YxeA